MMKSSDSELKQRKKSDKKKDKVISLAEVNKHNNEDDCWIILKGKVYNVTDFLLEHPGGDDVILNLAGSATFVHYVYSKTTN